MLSALVCGAGLWVGAASAAEPTEAQVRAEYTRWAERLAPKEYRVRHILVRTQAEAQQVLEQLKTGASFAELAGRISMDGGSKGRGGDLDWVQPAIMVREFELALRGADVGLYPEPVRTGFGWHVIRVDDIRPYVVPSFESMRADITARLARATPSASTAAPVPIPNWGAEQWNALLFTARHTAGVDSYRYRQAHYDDQESALRALALRILNKESRSSVALDARNLIDIAPPLRIALANLYLEGDVSQPVEQVLPNGKKVYTVLQLIKRVRAEPLTADAKFQGDAARWVSQGLLPDPDLLLKDTLARSRVAFYRAQTAAQIEAAPADLIADVEFGDGSTPLLNAMVRKDLPAAKALVNRGADVNRCGRWGCPLAMAAHTEDPAQALVWVEWLLQAGAKPDHLDPRLQSQPFATAMSAAAYVGNLPVMERLLAAGASANGVPNASDVPVEAAATAGRKDVVQWLMARGASVLPRAKAFGALGPRSLAGSAGESKDPSFIAWCEQAMLAEAARSPEFRVAVRVEQDGRELKPDGSGTLHLKPAPFNLLIQLPKGGEGVQVGASLQSAWAEEFRRGDLRNAMFRHWASGALPDTDKPDGASLLLSESCPSGARVDPGCEGVHMWLGTDESIRRDFHEQRRGAGGTVHVRKVDALFEPKPGNGDTPIQQTAGRTLYIGVGIPVAVGGAASQRFVQPQVLKLAFGQAPRNTR